jgi:hypothetical protein
LVVYWTSIDIEGNLDNDDRSLTVAHCPSPANQSRKFVIHRRIAYESILEHARQARDFWFTAREPGGAPAIRSRSPGLSLAAIIYLAPLSLGSAAMCAADLQLRHGAQHESILGAFLEWRHSIARGWAVGPVLACFAVHLFSPGRLDLSSKSGSGRPPMQRCPGSHV